jgi:hypothetical protein
MKHFILVIFILVSTTLFSQSKVGINTNSPSHELDIMSESDSEASTLRLTNPSFSRWIEIFGGSETYPNPSFIWSMSNSLLFATNENGYSEKLRINPSGNIGINEFNPSGRLHITANSTINYPQIRVREVGYDYSRIKFENTEHPNARWDIAGLTNGIPDLSKLNFYFSNDTIGGDRMTILGTGQIGIGNTNPEAKLEIKGGDWNLDAGNPGDVRVGNPTNNFRIGVATGGGGAGITRLYSKNSMLLGTDNSPHMTITAEGNVGVGTTNPSTKFQVNGVVKVNNLTGVGDRNVMVNSEGELKIGIVGQGDNDWVEMPDQVSTTREVYIDAPNPNTSSLSVIGRESNGNNFSALGIWNDAVGLFGSYKRLLIDANDIDAFRGAGASPISEDLYIQRQSDGNTILNYSDGYVGVGTTNPTMKLAVYDPVISNGSNAVFRVSNHLGSLRMDGKHIDASSVALYLNKHSEVPVVVGDGSAASGYQLCINGKTITEEVNVQLAADWPDYVFSEAYSLMPLSELESRIIETKHLPGIPSAKTVKEEGISLGEMQRKTMEKIEELTLYIIEMNKKNKALENRISELESK